MQHKANCSKFKNFNDNSFVFGVVAPLSLTTVTRKFNEYCDIAEVKRIRIHDLRHSHASLLISRGQNILAIAQRLGHSNVEQLLNRYGHLMPEDQKRLVNAINIDIK
ncbi:MAG: tyrosine-type recombinase/integrase [Christensenellaceae bacterium]|nr:tyrosine-type recombinase/integrase [Christensenellaceae bacterium]